MSVFISLLYVICVLFLLSWWMKRFHSKYEPPTFPGAVPLLGHAYMLLGNCVHVWDTFEKLAYYTLKVGGVSQLVMGITKFYILSNPEDISTVLKNYYKKAPVYNIARKWIGNGILTADVEPWKIHRKQLSPAFTKLALQRFMDMYNIQARRLVDKLSVEAGKGPFDQRTYVLNNILEITNQTTLGITNENNYVIDENYVFKADELMDMFIEKIQKVWLQFRFIYRKSDLKKRQDKIMNITKTLCLEVIQRQRLEMQNAKNEIQKNDTSKAKSVLDCMLEYMTDNEIHTDEYIRQHLETFIIASFDTTGASLVNVLKCVGVYSKVQDEIYKELEEVFGTFDRDVTVEDLTKLTYLEAVIKETLRLYPVIPIVGRTAPHDVKLKDYTIPKGETIICSIFAVHRHPLWGEDVEEFKPERWLGSKPPTGLFFGFGAGRRGCIGEQYAIMVMKLILAHVLHRYIISADNSKPVLKFNVMLKPVSGYEISIKKRS